ncbi:hypothetical protein CHS0354_026524, partial [Potamilus streckersoni]
MTFLQHYILTSFLHSEHPTLFSTIVESRIQHAIEKAEDIPTGDSSLFSPLHCIWLNRQRDNQAELQPADEDVLESVKVLLQPAHDDGKNRQRENEAVVAVVPCSTAADSEDGKNRQRENKAVFGPAVLQPAHKDSSNRLLENEEEL